MQIFFNVGLTSAIRYKIPTVQNVTMWHDTFTFLSGYVVNMCPKLLADTYIKDHWWRKSTINSLLASTDHWLNGFNPILAGWKSSSDPWWQPGNTTSTIQYIYTAQQQQVFEFSCANCHSRGPVSCRGSYVLEINTWIRNYGRPQAPSF